MSIEWDCGGEVGGGDVIVALVAIVSSLKRRLITIAMLLALPGCMGAGDIINPSRKIVGDYGLESLDSGLAYYLCVKGPRRVLGFAEEHCGASPMACSMAQSSRSAGRMNTSWF